MFFLFSSSSSSDFAYPKKPLPQTPEQSGELVPAVTVPGGVSSDGKKRRRNESKRAKKQKSRPVERQELVSNANKEKIEVRRRPLLFSVTSCLAIFGAG